MSPQNIVRVDGVPFPWQQQDLRGPNLFTGMKREMRALHAGSNHDRALRRPRHGNGPRSRPSDRADQTTSIHLNIEKRNGLDRLAAAVVREAKRLELIQRLFP